MRDEKGRIASQSERLILDIIHHNSGISRSALTRHTDWTQQSVYRMVDALISRDLLTASIPEKNVGPGQPSPQLAINQNALFSFGVSINTDVIWLSLVNLGCELIDLVIVETDPAQPEKAISDIQKTAYDLADEYHVPRDKIIGFGVSITGYRLDQSDIFMCPKPLKEWAERPLLPFLESGLSLPVWVNNNANIGAIAESLVGAGRSHDTFAYLSFNYGFGCGIIVDGHLMSGANNNAGEISVLYLENERRSRPALEGLIKRLQDNGSSIHSIRQLNQRFDPNLPGVAEWVEEVVPYLELSIRALAGVLDPSAIVFGGEAPPALRQILIDQCAPFDKLDKNRQPKRPVLLKSSIESDPATFGAALLPIKQTTLL